MIDKPKKSIYSRWWFWVIVFIIFVRVMALMQEGGYIAPAQTAAPSTTVDDTQVVQSVIQEIKSIIGQYDRMSNELDGVLRRYDSDEITKLEAYNFLKTLTNGYANLRRNSSDVSTQGLRKETRDRVSEIKTTLGIASNTKTSGIKNIMDYIDTGSIAKLSKAQDDFNLSEYNISKAKRLIEELE